MLRKRSGAALVIMAALATGSALAAERPMRTEGVGGAYKVAVAKPSRWISIVDGAEKLADQVKRVLAAAAEALRSQESVTAGGGDVKIAPPSLKGIGNQD
jgi:hypothetical protein